MTQDDSGRTKPGETTPGPNGPADPARADGGSSTDPEATTARALEPTPEGEIERLKAEVGALKDRLLRDRAELENFKRRQAREKADALRFANEGLLRDLLPLIDNLHRAVEHARGSSETAKIADGIEMTLRGLTEALERHGVKIVEALGRPFDPTHHEAVAQVESEHPPNTVVGEHQRGYLLHDRLLRPALVTVGKPRPSDENN